MLEAELHYSPISRQAIVSFALGILCIFGLVFPLLAFLAVPGIILGITAVIAIRRYELSGQKIAWMGIQLSLVFGILTPIWYEIRFRSEALPGYRRVNFLELMKDRKKSESKLTALIGQNVCFKGYELTPSRVIERNSFRMSYQRPPSGFGSKANPEDMVLVKLPEGKVWKWSYEVIAVSGTLIRNPAAQRDPEEPKFMLVQSEVYKALILDGVFLSGGGGRGGC